MCYGGRKQVSQRSSNKKTNKLQFSRTMYARAASKLSEAESQIEELSKSHKIMEPSKASVMSYELSLASIFDIGSDDKMKPSLKGSSPDHELKANVGTSLRRQVMNQVSNQNLDLGL